MISIDIYARFAKYSLIGLWGAFLAAATSSVLCHYLGIAGALKSGANAVCLVLVLPLYATIQYLYDAVGKVSRQHRVTLSDETRQRIAPLAPRLDAATLIGHYPSAELNAFAISSVFGNKALIAFSTGLLNAANDQQLLAIAAHEIAHIKNGDSRNKAFILAFSHGVRVYPYLLSELSKGLLKKFAIALGVAACIVAATAMLLPEARGELAGLLPMLKNFLFVLAWPAALIGAYIVLNRLLDGAYSAYSRAREFVADRDGAAMTSAQAMVSALSLLPEAKSGAVSVFDTHPPLEARRKRLEGRLRDESRDTH